MVYTVFIRHGESEANVAKDNSDAPETKLTKLGHVQAKKAAKYLAGLKFLGIKRILSSPYKRALDTAAPIAKAIGLKIEVVDDLREGSNGIIDGVKYDDIKKITKIVKKKNASGKVVETVYNVGARLHDIDAKLNKMVNDGVERIDPQFRKLIDEFVKLCEGETDLQIYKRIDKIVKKYKNESVLIVTHGGCIKQYLSHRYNIDAIMMGNNSGRDSNGKEYTNCNISIINNSTGQLEMMLDSRYLIKN